MKFTSDLIAIKIYYFLLTNCLNTEIKNQKKLLPKVENDIIIIYLTLVMVDQIYFGESLLTIFNLLAY